MVFSSAPLEIAFNMIYLSQALKALEGEHVVLQLNADNQQGILRGGEAEGEFIHLVMPLQL